MALSMSLVSVGMIVGITTAGKVLGGSTTMIGSLTQKYNPHGILYGLSSLVALISATVIAVRLPETLIDEKRIPFASTSILKKIKQSPASAARLVIGRGKQIRWLAILLVLQSLPTSMGDIFQGTLILVLCSTQCIARSHHCSPVTTIYAMVHIIWYSTTCFSSFQTLQFYLIGINSLFQKCLGYGCKRFCLLRRHLWWY